MSLHHGHLYEFGPFRLEPKERRLSRDGQDVPLPQKAFDVLVMLVSRAGHLVPKEDLFKQVWPGTFVEEANLSYTVSVIRKALHEGGGGDRYIDTVQKLGYRFTAAVRTLMADSSTPDEQSTSVGAPSRPHEPTSPLVPDVTQTRQWPGRSLRWAVVIAASALLLGVTGGVVLLRQMRPPASPETRAQFNETVPEHITLTRFDQPVISPDGRRVAFTGLSEGTRQLWVRPLESVTPIRLAGTEGAMLPFWSPDSRSLAFFADRKVKRIDAVGSTVTALCDAPFSLDQGSRGAWGADGAILFGDGAKGLVYRVSETGGVAEPVTRLDPARHEQRHYLQGFLSDNRRFVFRDDLSPPTFYVTSLSAPHERRTLRVQDQPDRMQHLSVAQGYLFYARDGAVVAQPLDERTLQPRGPMMTLAETESAPWQPRPSASRTGIIVFRSSASSMRQMTWRGRQGEHLETVDGPELYWQLDLSPTGTRAVLVRGGPWPQDRDLWLADLASGVISKLTTHPGLESSPAWSPDERRIAYHSSQGGGAIAPFVKDLATGKEEQQVLPTEGLSVEDWTAGDFLVLRSFGRAVFRLPLTGARKLEQLVDTRYSEDQLQVSPDGEWIAFNSDESEAWEVWIARFPQFIEKRQVSIGGGVQPRWARNGQELFYLAPDGTMMVLQRAGGGSSTFGAPRALFKTSLSPAAAELSEYDVTPDGQRFLILEHTRDRPQVLTYLLNAVPGFNK